MDSAKSGYFPTIRKNNSINVLYFARSGNFAEIAPFFALIFFAEYFDKLNQYANELPIFPSV